MFLTEIIVIAAMVALNGVFAAYEMALAAIPHARLMVLSHRQKKGAAAALFMKEHIEGSLAVVQVGITLAGAIAAATGGAGVEEVLAPFLRERFGLPEGTAEVLAVAALVAPLSAVTIAFAELIPKTYALENRERVCLLLSPTMRVFSRVASPVIALFERLVKTVLRRLRRPAVPAGPPAEDYAALHELTAAAGQARAERLISPREEGIVTAAAGLRARPLRAAAVPAEDISMIPLDLPLAEALLRAHLDLHTRFPVCERDGDAQSIRGYITFKDLVVALKFNPGSATVRGIMRPLQRVDAEIPLSQVLERMLREKTHIALVENGEKRVLGLVTLEDILEELVGDIEAEEDRLPAHLHATESGWIVGGGLPAASLAEALRQGGVEWENVSQNVSVAQWCEDRLGRPPDRGETFRLSGLRFTVRKLRRHRITEAFVARPDPAGTEDAGPERQEGRR